MRHSILHELLRLNYVVLPLAGTTKRPLVRWKQYQTSRPAADTALRWFQQWPHAELGILTGTLSGIICLDYDQGPYPTEGMYTRTPSGGRHYWHPYTPGDRHGLNVRPGLDIPHIVKVYAIPRLNYAPLPINGYTPTHRQPTVGTPPAPINHAALDGCRFMQHFQQRRTDPTWGNRYALARAYASNAAMCTEPDLDLGPEYRHTKQIIANVTLPITCKTIVNTGFNCPEYNPCTQECTLRPGARTPYGFALRATHNDQHNEDLPHALADHRNP